MSRLRYPWCHLHCDTNATHYCNTLLQHTTATHYCNALTCPSCHLYCDTTAAHYCNTLLQHTTATHYCNTLLQHTTATHYCNTLTCPWCHLYCDTRIWVVFELQSRDFVQCGHKLNTSLPHVSKIVHYQWLGCSCEAILIPVTFYAFPWELLFPFEMKEHEVQFGK